MIGTILLVVVILTSFHAFIYAQQKEGIGPGIKITSHTTGQQVPVGKLTISGISTDNATTNCQVYVDWNDLKPFQNASANGSSGMDDYSNWIFTYTDDYHLITKGINELTSKISCFDIPGDATTANATKYYTVNVTGISTEDNIITPSSESNRSNTSFSSQNSVVSNNGSSFHSSTRNIVSGNGSGTISSSQSVSNGHCVNKVISGSGNDILSSNGDCDDEFSGGSGADKFTCGMGKDIITDFNKEEGDTIVDPKNCESIQKRQNP